MELAPGARRVHVALIHHDSPERMAPARQAVQVLSSALSGIGRVSTSQVARQPEVGTVATGELVARTVRQWRLEREWATHIGAGRRWVLSTGLLVLRLLQLAGPRRRRHAGRKAFVEHLLTQKHLLAWQQGYQDDVDLLAVLEDDVRSREDSGVRTAQLLHFAEPLPAAFIDLAGGLLPRQLRLQRVSRPLSDGISRIHPAATNTLCGYALGREVLALLVTHAIREPAALRLPADWFVNHALMTHARLGGVPVLCLHADPPAFVHGSLAGLVASTIR